MFFRERLPVSQQYRRLFNTHTHNFFFKIYAWFTLVFFRILFFVCLCHFSLLQKIRPKNMIFWRSFFFYVEITIWDNYIFSSSIHFLSPSIYMFFSISVSTTTILMQDLKSHNWMSLIVDKTESFVSSLDSSFYSTAISYSTPYSTLHPYSYSTPFPCFPSSLYFCVFFSCPDIYSVYYIYKDLLLTSSFSSYRELTLWFIFPSWRTGNT